MTDLEQRWGSTLREASGPTPASLLLPWVKDVAGWIAGIIHDHVKRTHGPAKIEVVKADPSEALVEYQITSASGVILVRANFTTFGYFVLEVSIKGVIFHAQRRLPQVFQAGAYDLPPILWRDISRDVVEALQAP